MPKGDTAPRLGVCANGGCGKDGSKRCGGCGQVLYCSVECQKSHWKINHKVVCKATAKAKAKLATKGVTGRVGRARGIAAGACIICLDSEDDPAPIQSGCACRGDAGWAHVACRVKLAEHSEDPSASSHADAWQKCGTCHMRFGGAMELELARELWRQVQLRPKVDVERRVDAQLALGDALINNGMYDEAEVLLRKTLASATRGLDDSTIPLTQISSALSTAISNQPGRLAEAVSIDRRNLATAQRLLGSDDRLTMQYSTQLAENLGRLGEAQECIKLCRVNVQANERVYGRDNHNTLECMSVLADELTKQFNLDEAEPLWQETLTGMKRVLGPEHPATLQSSVARARCFLGAGRIKEAIALTSETFETCRRVMGSEHPQTLKAGQFLAMAENMRNMDFSFLQRAIASVKT